MSSGPVSLVDGGKEFSHANALWWRDGWPQRVVPHWSDATLPTEIGSRAYRYLTVEARRMWPPGLEDAEELGLE